jgi:hypothetical protein
MSTIRNAILNWADTPGIEIQELTESRIDISTPWGSAALTLKGDTCEIEAANCMIGCVVLRDIVCS